MKKIVFSIHYLDMHQKLKTEIKKSKIPKDFKINELQIYTE